MHGDTTQRKWIIRGFHFNIIETKHWLPSGSISLFSCESLDGLVHDDLRELTLEGAIEEIEDRLPEWIERTRASGRETRPYDSTLSVQEDGSY